MASQFRMVKAKLGETPREEVVDHYISGDCQPPSYTSGTVVGEL
jgi:hypothetical protein